jgi:hypothetical protein
MKKQYVLLSIPAMGIIFLLMAYSSGSPGGKSGSPGDNGSTCVDCHTGTVNPVSGWISTNIPITGYVPGNTYTITLTGTHNGVVKFGFEVTAEDVNGTKVGTLILTDPVQTKFTNGTATVTHTSSGNTPSGNTKTWTVDWTAPTAGTGNVGLYAAINAANGNGNNSGDVQLELWDISGINREGYFASTGSNIIDLSSRPAGVYFLNIRSETRSEIRKIIIR